MDRDGLLNIYEQYCLNNYRYGFFIKRHNWKSTTAQVLFFAGVNEGDKPRGNPPYFNNPRVYARLYYAKSAIEINTKTRSRIITIYDGGTYSYEPL